MKILLTVEFYEPHKGGAEEVVKQIAERLVMRGHEVVVGTTFLPERRERTVRGVKIEEFKIGGNSASGIRGTREEIKRYQDFVCNGGFDVVCNHTAQIWTTDLVFPVLGSLSAKKVLVPTGYSRLHDPAYQDYFDELPRHLRAYDKIVYMSANYQDKKFGDENGAGGKAVIIPNGASDEEFLPRDAFRIKEMLGIKTPYLIITVANHYKAKGHGFVIEAFKKMRRNDATILIIGNIPGAGGMKKIGHLMLGCYFDCWWASKTGKNIRIVSGNDRALVLSAYKSADIFLLGSEVECAPLVMYESFAAKLPFITTDVGNVKDHRDYIKIVRTPEEMADAARHFLDSPEERKNLAEKAFHVWHTRHTWQNIAERYEELFRALCSCPKESA